MIDRATGIKTRGRYKTLKLNELSAVDNPAQEGALMSIMKRGEENDVTDLDKSNITAGNGAQGGDNQMTDLEKALAEIETLKGQITTLTGERDSAVAKADKASKDEADAKAKFEEMKKTAGDEILKIGDTEIRKSAVGDGTFAAMKAQQGEIEKANDRAATAEFEKRAGTELAHVVGTDAEKGAILKAASRLPEADRTALDAILKSAEQMAKGAFERLGIRHENIADVAKAASDFNGKVADIAKRDGVAQHVAMQKARAEHPDLFKAMQQHNEAARA